MKRSFSSIPQVQRIYLATALFLIGLSLYTFIQLQNLIKTNEAVRHTNSINRSLERSSFYVLNMKVNRIQFVASKDSNYYTAYLKAIQDLNIEQVRLDSMIHHPTQVKNLIHLQKMLNLSSRRSHASTPFQEAVLLPLNTSKEMTTALKFCDTVNQQIDDMKSFQLELRDQQLHKYNKLIFVTPLFLIVLFLGALLILVVSYSRIIKAMNASIRMQMELKLLVVEAPVGICMVKGSMHTIELCNESFCKLVGRSDVEGKQFSEVISNIESLICLQLLHDVYQDGKEIQKNEIPFVHPDDSKTKVNRFFNVHYNPILNSHQRTTGVIINIIEVTEQVLANKKAEESQISYNNMLMQSPVAISVLKGENMVVALANESMKSLWGKGSDVEGKELLSIVPELKEQEFPALLQQVYHTGEAHNGYEAKAHIMRDGVKDEAYFNFVIQPYFEPDGCISGITTIAIEVTNEVLGRKQIEQTEMRFRSLANSAPVLIWMSGEDKLCNFFNITWLNFTGRSMEQELGDGWSQSVHPDDIQQCLSHYTNSFTSRQKFYMEYRLKRYDGVYRWISDSGVPNYDELGVFKGYIGACMDIHDQKLQLDLVKESEERFRTLSETLPQLVWITNSQGVQEFASCKWEEMTGVKPGGEYEWQAIVHPDDLDEINKAWSESLINGTVYKHDVRLKMRNGQYKWHTVNGVPIFNSQNEIVKWVGAFTDTDSEKNFATQLQNKVDMRTAELLEKNSTLEKLNKELELFAHISSHDLQEPLRKIQMSTSRILEKDIDLLSPKSKEHFKRVQEGATAIQALIEDLTTYAQTKSDYHTFEKTDLNHLMQEVTNGLQNRIDEKKAVIKCEGLIELNIIPFQFRQLLHNLISNSLKFAIIDTTPRIWVKGQIVPGKEIPLKGLDTEATYYHLSVRDNGIGFDPQYKHKIFEIFQRLHGNDQFKGSGIGLAIVQKIVENHQGFIDANSVKGQGATFNIYLPFNLNNIV